MPLLAGGINFQDVHSGLGLTPSFRQQQCEILAFILTLISACRCMSSDLSRIASIPACLPNRLQSVINAAARLIAGLRRLEHIIDALASFHWLRTPERIKFKLAVILYRALHGTAPQYLSGQLQYVADLLSRRQVWLRWLTSSLLDVRPSRLVTVSDRSFAAADP